MDIEKYNDYRNGVHSGENAEDALGATAHIAETLAPAMLVAVLKGDWLMATAYALQIRDQAAAQFAADDDKPARTGRDPEELADEEVDRRKDQARDDFDFYDYDRSAA